MEKGAGIIVEQDRSTTAEGRMVELVERKGIGHPDTICDSVMEAASLALSKAYREQFGRILHHNLDKGLLIAGRTAVKPGGGRVLEPMKMIFGDRATSLHRGVKIPVGEIVEAAAQSWLQHNLRFVDPLRHITFQNEIKPGSDELTDLFSRQLRGANDTSAGAGYAPLSATELMVLQMERFINSSGFKKRFPESGEDVKVMGFRNAGQLTLTVAMAFVDRHISGVEDYFMRKSAILEVLRQFAIEQDHPFEGIQVDFNTLDDPSRGTGGMYLTVLGTSAEGADGGEVGRGNRVNGLIAFGRPLSLEAAAGKNPVNHTGKIYNILAFEIARRIHRETEAVLEVSVFLCSQIGRPLSSPLAASARVVLQGKTSIEEVRGAITGIMEDELARVEDFTRKIAEGAFPVC
ncbi:methionine adenosyltransferase [Pelodictyon luteolum]|uniref:Methionine adenosyltransferase n=1 Tax=Chlorobium luteolum (strain DSM 273 / BCRC 81028 / 2530) TaxID=319225 RepID=Q3B5E6_CHLL3|nr:methionine adenosyltransferase [Pelodictyon luteolum]ABB23435.1 methionine adenosyltransferase [Pelodictyon luteolum DSM 273]